jgi:hypothetical protein
MTKALFLCFGGERFSTNRGMMMQTVKMRLTNRQMLHFAGGWVGTYIAGFIVGVGIVFPMVFRLLQDYETNGMIQIGLALLALAGPVLTAATLQNILIEKYLRVHIAGWETWNLFVAVLTPFVLDDVLVLFNARERSCMVIGLTLIVLAFAQYLLLSSRVKNAQIYLLPGVLSGALYILINCFWSMGVFWSCVVLFGGMFGTALALATLFERVALAKQPTGEPGD